MFGLDTYAGFSFHSRTLTFSWIKPIYADKKRSVLKEVGMGQEKCSCKPSESTGVNRLIDELVNAWFNESSGKSLSERQRFGFAFVGSGMFFLVFVPVNFAGSLTNNAALSILSDKGLGISQIIAYAFLAVFAIFIAFIVSWRNTRSGATRLFLSGVLLPTFVLSILSILSIRLG